MILSPYDIAYSYIGLAEIPGPQHNPIVVGMLHEFGPWIADDETAWCGGFVGHCARRCRLIIPRKPLAARQWLTVGTPKTLAEAVPGFDVAILRRGPRPQPGPDVINAPGHVTFFAGVYGPDQILGLGGNQHDEVRISLYNETDLLGIRRLMPT